MERLHESMGWTERHAKAGKIESGNLKWHKIDVVPLL